MTTPDRPLFSEAEVRALLRVGHEARLRPEAKLEDIDLEMARRFLSRTIYKDRPAEDVLESYGLIVRKPVHASRNPLMVRVLADAGLMREEGEGIPRIFEEMEASFLHEPKFRVESGEFSVTLRNEPVFVGADPEWRRLNKVDRDQAYQEIQEMVAQGIVRSAGSRGRGAVYRVSPDLLEARAFLSERLTKLRGCLSRQGMLRNADYRELFRVTRYAAVRELGRLVEGGYLVMAGERRGARYTAGPALEATAKK